MTELKKVIKQLSFQLVGKIVSSLSTLIILGIVARNFGEGGTGVYTLALTFISFFYLASDAGVNAYIMPGLLGPQISSQFQKLLSTRIIMGLVWVFVASAILFFWPEDQVFKLVTFFGLFSIFFYSIYISCNGVFQSKSRYDLAILATSLGALITLLLVLFFAKNSPQLYLLLVANLVGWIVTCIVSLIVVKKFVRLKPIFDLRFSLSIFKNSWPITLTLVLNVVYFRADSFILSFYKNFSDVGIYNLAYQVFQAILVIPTFIMNGYYPLMLKDFENNLENFGQKILKACLLMLTLGFLATIFTYFLSPFVLPLLTGKAQFSGSIVSLQILSYSFSAFFVSSILMWTLVVLKKYKAMLFIYLFGLITNIFLNLIFIPAYSYVASSYITGVSEGLILFLEIVLVFKFLQKKVGLL